MTIQEIITALETSKDKFPQQAMKEAIERREEIIPELLRILEHVAYHIEQYTDNRYCWSPAYSIYLLAQFREKRAYQPLVDFASAKFEIVDGLLGDIITEDLGRILASVCNGDISLICGMIENPNLNEYIRSAGLDALEILLAQGVIPREEVISYFRNLFHGQLERKISAVWGTLVIACSEIYTIEFSEEIHQAFEDGLIETDVVDEDYLRESMAVGETITLSRLARDPKKAFINDVIRELSWWACFNPTPDAKSAHRNIWELHDKPALVPTEIRVGRNDPCPCGSGKKFKKCCLE
ncbi:MAG: DUF1186 domain-containing protein [Armatimonadota bacterium]